MIWGTLLIKTTNTGKLISIFLINAELDQYLYSFHIDDKKV